MPNVSGCSRKTLVAGLPKTGRTHQIRVHLGFLGYPITNDPLYNARVNAARGSVLLDDDDERAASSSNQPDTSNWKVEAKFSEGDVVELDTLDPVSICPDCRGRDPNTSRFKDPIPDEMCIYLHALSYRSKEWHFKTDAPAWVALV